MGVSSAVYSSQAPRTESRQPWCVKIAALVPLKVYAWLRASSVPKSSAVPDRSYSRVS